MYTEEGGPAAGNPLMEQYDPFAARITKTVNAFVQEQAAAGSEEMASSSEELGAQAAALRDLVSRFKTDTSRTSSYQTSAATTSKTEETVAG